MRLGETLQCGNCQLPSVLVLEGLCSSICPLVLFPPPCRAPPQTQSSHGLLGQGTGKPWHVQAKLGPSVCCALCRLLQLQGHFRILAIGQSWLKTTGKFFYNFQPHFTPGPQGRQQVFWSCSQPCPSCLGLPCSYPLPIAVSKVSTHPN